MIGSTVSHYTILEKLGEGGMGVVYRAHDTTLDREVALKFLPPHISGTEEEQARFIQEAKSASALNHPNVCSIHSIGSHEGQKFIDMEFVDGATLRKKIESRKLSVDDAIHYAIQIGEALHEAHMRGIIHRDVKAENIMVNHRDQIKVMDFGLAKLKGSLKLTRTSSTVGTLAYMAPEQIQGSEADARSDIFSFGVVLYEMLTGSMPFRGEHEAAMVYSIVNEEPEPLQKHLPDISPEILHIVGKALDKNPEDRYQSVGDMLVDLRRARKDSARLSRQTQEIARSSSRLSNAVHQMPSRRWLVVLGAILIVLVLASLYVLQPWGPDSGMKTKTLVVIPFENQGDPEKEYFVDGITDEITGRLSQLSGLGVIARSSARQYKGTSKTLDQIGEELGVDYILTGTVRWSGSGGDRIRVNPELIEVKTRLQTWSQPYEADFSDAFTIQSHVASRVAEALDLELVQRDREKLDQQLTSNPEAYDLYLKAVEYENRGFAREDFESSMLMYERAIEKDPAFAAAYARLSRLHSGYYWFFYDRTKERVEMARIAADKALSLNPRLSDAYSAKGWYFYHGKLDYEKALEQFNIALTYWPNNPDVYYGIGAVRRRQGDMKGAVDALRRCVAMDPLDVEKIRQVGESLSLDRSYADAELEFDRVLTLAPDNSYSLWNKGLNILLWTGDTKRATAAIANSSRTGEDADGAVTILKTEIAWYERDYAAAKGVIEEFRKRRNVLEDQFVYRPISLIEARVEHTIGDASRARVLFEEARKLVEEQMAGNPEDARLPGSLGIALAGLGQRDAAVRMAEQGVRMLPVEKEAWRGSSRLIDLAEVYTMVGQKEKAIDTLTRLLSIPCYLSARLLEIDPTWDSLRSDPRFQDLVSRQ